MQTKLNQTNKYNIYQSYFGVLLSLKYVACWSSLLSRNPSIAFPSRIRCALMSVLFVMSRHASFSLHVT